MCSETTDAGTEARAGDAQGGDVAERTAAGDRQAEVELLRFDLLRSALYHDDREQGLSRRNRWFAFATVVLGSSFAVTLLGEYPVAGLIAAALTVLINAAALVFDYAGGARDHRELKRRYYELLADAEAAEPDTAAIRRRMTLIYADEPPFHRALNAVAHNQAGDLIWGPGKYNRARIGLAHRLTRNLLTWRTSAFPLDPPPKS